MKLLRLQVESFAAIGKVDIEFGPGLNVLYGPNDLGKSTVAECIRFALLLPHNSTHCESYVAWTGGGDPTVELTFADAGQRIWRVRKQFGKPGSSLLQESKNGHEFDDVAKARQVDGKLREILRWGIPEPGGAHAPRGMPGSFLATALLSPQAEVSAILGQTLQEDPSGSGKEQIAAALEAVAQDPLFIELRNKTQERRDAAYTDKGAKKTAKGSVFKEAADRVIVAQREKEALERIVEESGRAEQQLRDSADRKIRKQDEWETANAHLASLELLARKAGERVAAEELVRLAGEEVRRIENLRAEVEAAEGEVAALTSKVAEARAVADMEKSRKREAEAALAAAQESARGEESDPAVTHTQLQLRRSVAERAAHEIEQRIASLRAARKYADAAASAARELEEQRALAEGAARALADAEQKEKTVDEELLRCSLLERAMEVAAAESLVKSAQAAVDSKAALERRLEATLKERALLVEQRAAIVVPAANQLSAMRRLETELATARGTLDVGLVATVIPDRALELTVRKDGGDVESISLAQPREFDANAELQIAITGVAVFGVRGGRREAQARVAALATRWNEEVVAHLVAAGVEDLDGLGAKVAEAQQHEAGMQQKDSELRSLREQVAGLGGVAETLHHAMGKAEACRAALGQVDLHPLLEQLAALGGDAGIKLTRRRQKLAQEVATTRGLAQREGKEHVVAEERVRHARSALDAAIASRNIALEPFPDGVDVALFAAQAEQVTRRRELQTAENELKSLDAALEAQRKRIESAERNARVNLEKAGAAVNSAEQQVEEALKKLASHEGRLGELRKARDAANLSLAGGRLGEATQQYNALPVPERMVSQDELAGARATAETLKSELNAIERDIQRAHGALEQVGGAVARERLFDATEACEAAERREREIEAEYESWKLLLEQMKEADAAQASNLGFALAPAVADGFSKLTQQRYQTVKLKPQLETEGVVVAGTVRPVAQLSVGTREQLSTLFRLSLAEFLHTAIVLDDQLVQSDGPRMGWFRELLAEKAHGFQIIVLTCRPSDYLSPTAVVPDGSAVYTDAEGAPIRAIDLGRALHRR